MNRKGKRNLEDADKESVIHSAQDIHDHFI